MEKMHADEFKQCIGIEVKSYCSAGQYFRSIKILSYFLGTNS